jgi:hypothetical protein
VNSSTFYLLVVDFQKRSFQDELCVLLPLLEQLKKVEEGSENQAVILVLQVGFPSELSIK